MSAPLEIVLIIAAVGYLLVRRMMGEPAEGKRMLILPAVLTVLGLTDLSDVGRHGLAVVFLVITGLISVGLGVLRGFSVRLQEREGVAFVQYTGVTVALWVVNLVLKFGANLVLGLMDQQAASAFSDTLLLTLGAGMLAEGGAVLLRALQRGHHVIWAQGRAGQPHTTSPLLDGLQARMTERRR